MTHEQDRAKAERYERWFEEDGLKDALQAIKDGYVQSLLNSHVSDTQGRENCYIAANIVDKIEAHILGVIGGGKLAVKEIERIEKEQTKRKIINFR